MKISEDQNTIECEGEKYTFVPTDNHHYDCNECDFRNVKICDIVPCMSDNHKGYFKLAE